MDNQKILYTNLEQGIHLGKHNLTYLDKKFFEEFFGDEERAKEVFQKEHLNDWSISKIFGEAKAPELHYRQVKMEYMKIACFFDGNDEGQSAVNFLKKVVNEGHISMFNNNSL